MPAVDMFGLNASYSCLNFTKITSSYLFVNFAHNYTILITNLSIFVLNAIFSTKQHNLKHKQKTRHELFKQK